MNKSLRHYMASTIAEEVKHEINRTEEEYGPFHSLHEGLAVLREEYQELERAMQELRKWHQANGTDKPMPEWKLKRKLGLSPTEFDAVSSELVRRRLVHYGTHSTGRRPTTGFCLR